MLMLLDNLEEEGFRLLNFESVIIAGDFIVTGDMSGLDVDG